MQLDKRLFENLCGLQCTEIEIATCLNCSVDTLERWCKREYKRKFAEVFKEKRTRGFVSLRRMQWKLAEKNAAMLIFLGKNYLGQSDKQDINKHEVNLHGQIGVNSLAELMLEDENTNEAN